MWRYGVQVIECVLWGVDKVERKKKIPQNNKKHKNHLPVMCEWYSHKNKRLLCFCWVVCVGLFVCAWYIAVFLFILGILKPQDSKDNGFTVPDSSSLVSFHKAKFSSDLGYNIMTQDQCTRPKKSQGMLSDTAKTIFWYVPL